MTKFIEPPADTPFNRRLADGHLIRTGHKLEAVQVSDDGVLWHRVYQCCGQEVSAAVATWDETTPQPDDPKR